MTDGPRQGNTAGTDTGAGTDSAGDESTPVVTPAAKTAEPAPQQDQAGPSRRFQAVTEGTARPEGGGRAAAGDAPAPARQWPILGVAGAVALGLVLIAADTVRPGMVLIGAALLAGALMRWALPSVGMLAVRSRFTDVITYGVLGAVIVLLALMAQPHPVLEIPFLEDVVRFSVR
ncbi:DUF3017 domain-containing protein [Streptomyces sp. NPDC046977]|uniref:DUF3017 domain-containing protein n=1 Tax=Streptomyces sp. NPDC046977 TaxID=3154703 RepID=UPI0033EA2ADC